MGGRNQTHSLLGIETNIASISDWEVARAAIKHTPY